MSQEQAQILIYEDADKAVEVRLDEGRETVWLTQRQMSEVFGTSPENVLMHLKNIFIDEELSEEATAKDFLVVRQEGRRRVQRNLKHYNLDAIISVGYRVNSRRAVRFRQWATRVLRDHLTQGWTLHQQRFEANARHHLNSWRGMRQSAIHLSRDRPDCRFDVVTDPLIDHLAHHIRLEFIGKLTSRLLGHEHPDRLHHEAYRGVRSK